MRRTWDIPSGGYYRKVFDSWEICDYEIRYYTPVMFQDHVAKMWEEYENHAWWTRHGAGWVLHCIYHPKRK